MHRREAEAVGRGASEGEIMKNGFDLPRDAEGREILVSRAKALAEREEAE